MTDPIDPLARTPDPEQATAACRALILAYCKEPEEVDWSDVQEALDLALRAFGLPLTYPEEFAARRKTEDAERAEAKP
ncbi:hypothetical protein [Marinivivus vitaminiproducens]|uniref:hypothetical protein n=1 Tax=Marinivivus vitaminiproducens TaxID=3035935 RepID=UPI0027A3FFE3|nr:hypothetical protein P4R82_24715 [Geminicoccaceae bacterium SCSIO 64248]